MNHSLCVVAALLLPFAAVAAPAPEPFVGGWGNPLDPDRDCKIRRNRGVLTIELPGTTHDYDPLHGRANAPRLLRDIEGNFQIQVRVQIDSCPSAQSTVKDQPSCVAAGFLLIYPEPNLRICDRFEYGISEKGVGLDRYAVEPHLSGYLRRETPPKGIGEGGYAAMKNWHGEFRKIDKTVDRGSPKLYHTIWDPVLAGWPLSPMPKKTNSTYLRLEHQDIWYRFLISPDGDKWTELVKCSGPPTKLKLGLAAYSTSPHPSKVRFDQLKLWRPK